MSASLAQGSRLALLLAAACPARAAETASFLNLGVGARALAMASRTRNPC